MDAITRIGSDSRFASAIGFSGAVRAGNLIMLAGISAISPDGVAEGADDPYEQARVCLAKAVAALSEVGATTRDVVHTRMYLTDPTHWEAVGRAHRETFGAAPPAATMVVTALLDPRMLVEIEVMAYAT